MRPGGEATEAGKAHQGWQRAGAGHDGASPLFERSTRAGRVYAGGIADAKAGVMAHIAALRVHSGALPVGVTVFVEGGEDSGSDSLGPLLERPGETLAAAAAVRAASPNLAAAEPARPPRSGPRRGAGASPLRPPAPRPRGVGPQTEPGRTREARRPRVPANGPCGSLFIARPVPGCFPLHPARWSRPDRAARSRRLAAALLF